MSYTTGLLIFGIPAIIWLTVRAVRRIQSLKDRIADVQEDMARHPQSPYQAMAELFSPPPPPPQERPHAKRHD